MNEWDTAHSEPIIILVFDLLESKLSKPNINIILLFQKKSIHTLENKVLMRRRFAIELMRRRFAIED